MTRQDVRIGNYIYVVNKETGHKEVGRVNPMCLIAWNESKKYEYKPIPMTSDWCKKLDVEPNLYDKKYVHEVQNIHFALTGEEL